MRESLDISMIMTLAMPSHFYWRLSPAETMVNGIICSQTAALATHAAAVITGDVCLLLATKFCHSAAMSLQSSELLAISLPIFAKTFHLSHCRLAAAAVSDAC